MSAHAQPRDGTRFLLRNGGIMFVRILHQFRRDKSLVTIVGILRTVPIPAVLAIGAYKDDALLVGNLAQVRLNAYPCTCISAESMQQIDRRASLSLLVQCLVWKHIDHLHLLLHRRAFHSDRIHSCRLCRNHGKQHPNAKKKLFTFHIFHSLILSVAESTVGRGHIQNIPETHLLRSFSMQRYLRTDPVRSRYGPDTEQKQNKYRTKTKLMRF